jgi:eukaryotic-like serine/threonine-protein kinase
MTLAAGSRLGPYEIQSAIGAGGMGEVFKARDTRLERDVAVKILKTGQPASEELKQRFLREAKAISQLSHPHICTLFDVGTHEGTEYLVMELLEGETLASRLAKGPMTLAQLLPVGMQIADALDRAHRQGIVHRDLKPGNVMLTKSGVKLLDFGLAKALAPSPGSSGLTSLATVTTPQHLTERGTILGTFQYMSPEQLEGGEADARSDIFALGAVLFEMATGKKAFEGKSQASVIGSILKQDPPPVSSLAPMTPPALDRVIATCLAKDPENRFQTAHDVKLQLQWIAEGGSQVGLPAPIAARRRSREKLAWALAGAAMLAAIALGIGYLRRAPMPPHAVRFEMAMPDGMTSVDAPRISPDGRTVAFNAIDTTGKARIWVRPLNMLAAHPLDGTEGTTRPFWSPDGRYIGFFAEGKLKKIEPNGGPAQKICDAPSGSDGSWGADGVILFDGRTGDPIMRVSAAGGTATPIVKVDTSRKEVNVAWPEFLPDGRHFLYMAQGVKVEDNAYRVGSLDSPETKVFASAQTLISYAPPGYLLFVRDKTLVAQRFDAKALKTTGEPVPLVEHIGTDNVGLARFSVSREGTLVYRTADSGNRLVFVDASGRELETIGDPADYGSPDFSPQGDRLAYDLNDPRSGKLSVWIRDLKRGVSSRFTFGNADAFTPLWSPDGRTIVYTQDQDLFAKPVDGRGEEKMLVKSDGLKIACSMTPDGKTLVYFQRDKETGWDIWTVGLTGSAKPVPFLKTPFAEILPNLSPDGRFLAYQSDESGRAETYVQTFPEGGGKWQISSAGGLEPHWSADGKSLFFRSPGQKVMSVDVETRNGFSAGVPKLLFGPNFDTMRPARDRYLPARDAKRFLVVATLGREALSPIVTVLNWPAELGR